METVGGHQLTIKGPLLSWRLLGAISSLSKAHPPSQTLLLLASFTWSYSSDLSRLPGVCDMGISPFPFFVPGDAKKIAVTIWDLQVVRVVYLMFPIPVMRLVYEFLAPGGST